MNYSTTDEAIRQAHNKQLSFFFDTMPRKVGVGNTRHIEDIIKRPSLEDAVKYPFIQHNFPQRHFITFETTKNPMFEIIVQDLPCPTMIVGDSVFYDADVSYQFLEPIPQKPSRKTRELLRDVRTAYRTMLRARRVIGVHTPIRNPSWEKDGSPGYEVIATGKPVTLTELAESIPATIERRPLYQVHDTSAFEATSDADSRNCSLFETARRYAYGIVGKMGNEDELYDAIEAHVIDLNDNEISKYFDVKIQSVGELKRTARSISRWTWKRRSQFKTYDVGAMGLESMTGHFWPREEWEREVRRRQRKAAKWTNRKRKAKTRVKIRQAVKECQRQGMKPNVSNIARLADVSRPTVYTYKDLLP